MSILAQFRKARATGQGSNYVKPGKGEVLIKDMLVKDTYGEAHRFIVEFYTVSSAPVEFDKEGKPVPPNAPGTSWAVQEQLTKVEGAMERAKGMIAVFLGEDGAAMTDDQITDAFADLCRLDAEGHTDPKKGPCPLRGVRLSYETRNKKIQKGTKAGTEIVVPQFKLIDETEAQIAANRKVLDGAGAGEGATA